MAFEDILRSINEETDRTQLASMAVKYPSLKEFAELGERVAPLRARLQSLEYTDFDPAIKELENWRGWKTSNYDPTTRMTFEEKRVKQALATAQAKINELELRGDADMTPEEIRQIVQESITATLAATGVVDSKALETRLTDLVTNEKLTQNLNGLTTRFEDVFDKIEDVIGAHQTNFGERIRPKVLFEHMKKTGEMDPDKAYADMVGPRLAEKTKTEWEAKIVEAALKGEEKGRREVAQSSAGRGMPVDGKGGQKIGVLQRRVMERNKGKADENTTGAPLGKGVIAAHAAAQLRERELAGSAN